MQLGFIIVTRQCITKLNKWDILREKRLNVAQREYANALTFIDMYYSPSCWKDVDKCRKGFDALESKITKIDAVKEELWIKTVGFGWKNLYHPWSKGGTDYLPQF